MSVWNPYQQSLVQQNEQQHYSNSYYTPSPSDADNLSTSYVSDNNTSCEQVYQQQPQHYPYYGSYLSPNDANNYGNSVRSSSVNSSDFCGSDIDSSSSTSNSTSSTTSSPVYTNQKLIAPNNTSQFAPTYYYNAYRNSNSSNYHQELASSYNNSPVNCSNYYYNQNTMGYYTGANVFKSEPFEYSTSALQAGKPTNINVSPKLPIAREQPTKVAYESSPVGKPAPVTQQTRSIVSPTQSVHTIDCNNINFKYPATMKSNPDIKINMQDMNLWNQFAEMGTEMIITKGGRRMFPCIRLQVSGLDPNAKYIMFIDIVPFDDNRYKYSRNEWLVNGKAEPHFNGLAYLHQDSPMSGNHWMKQVISFQKLKLTNNPTDRNGLIILNSMHKYVPRLHIVEEGKTINTFILNESQFMAVTQYQNEGITKLKIAHNPFAKGFRDGQNKRRNCPQDNLESESSQHQQNGGPVKYSKPDYYDVYGRE